MGKKFGSQVKLAAVEQDSRSVVGELSKTASSGFNGLHSAVEPFADGIGDFVSAVGEEVFQMTVNHLRYLLDWFQFAASCPAKPFLEELPCPVSVVVCPKDSEVFLDGPSLGGL